MLQAAKQGRRETLAVQIVCIDVMPQYEVSSAAAQDE